MVPSGLRVFPDGGLSVWHGEIDGHRIDLAFDHGPLGYLSIAAHGHADALSLVMSIDGQPVLVDPGTFAYGTDNPWRRWFRSTAAHNTLNIEGADQSQMAGPFNWSQKAHAELLESTPSPLLLRARHDGYASRFGAIHERTITERPDGIAISDRLIGRAQAANLVFQLAPGVTASQEGGEVTVLRGDEAVLTIQFPDASVSIASGGETPGSGGWVSPRFGEKHAAPRLVWRGMIGAEGALTMLLPFPRSAAV
jgi:uncharacterized heparinase superfamily protein